MSLPTTSPRLDYSQLYSLLQKKPSPPPPKRKRQKRQNVHSWTDEELNLLSYLRYLHHWRFGQIQKSFFPFLSLDAVRRAYQRLPTGDHEHRASTAATLITNSRSDPSTQSTCSGPEQGTNHRRSPISRPFCLLGNGTETLTLSSPSSATGDEPVISNNSNTKRYNLRPNRPTAFPQRKPRCLVDRRRFPHFSKSFGKHLKLDGTPDRDYVLPSHSPTPDPSDRSPSAVSSLPSVASSTELFGLEARSPSSSDHDSSVNPSLPRDESSPEFLSAEECLPTP